MIKGIYGFEITKVYDFTFFRIIPLYTKSEDVKEYANSLDFNLTAFLQYDENKVHYDDFEFYLESILSFVEQQEVIIKEQFDHIPCYDELDEKILFLNYGNRKNKIRLFWQDNMNQNDIPKKDAIDCIATKIFNPTNTIDEKYIHLFCKYTELLRFKKNFIEIDYFLLFSGLESFCREYLNDYTSSIESIFSNVLGKQLNIPNIRQDCPIDLVCSMRTYACLRNALFHNDNLATTITHGTSKKEVSLIDYSDYFQRLVIVTILKYVGFNSQKFGYHLWKSERKVPFIT